MIVAQGLEKTYTSGGRPLPVLKSVNLEVPPKSFVAVVGPSGSGKTTLLGLLAGLDEPSGGRVYLDGTDVFALTEDDRAGFRAERRAVSLLDQVGLGDRLDHYPAQLSGGEQQRVALARAFANEPKILFADEPTGNLDQETGATIVSMLEGLNQAANTTLVMVTHDLQLAERAHRIVRLRDGRIVEDRPGGGMPRAAVEEQAT